MQHLLSESQLHDKFNEKISDDISENLTIHEYKIVGLLSALITFSDSKGFKLSFNELKKAYRIGGMHINVIDRADDVLDGERGFQQTEDAETFLEIWLDTIRSGEIRGDVTESERVALEACICFRKILSEEALDRYYQKMCKVVELEKKISKEAMGPEEEYRSHLKSAGICLEALAIPLAQHTSYQGNSRELKEMGKYFQIVDDIQDLDDDNYFPSMTRADARTRMRDIQKDVSKDLGKAFSRTLVRIFGKYLPILDDYVNFKEYV